MPTHTQINGIIKKLILFNNNNTNNNREFVDNADYFLVECDTV
jgi:hypothetical protein